MSAAAIVDYVQNVRERTMRLVRCIPPDKLDFTYSPGKFTLGDLMRHLATTERYVFAECLQDQPTRYAGCGKNLADGYQNIIAYMERLHQESMAIFSGFTEEQ